MVMVLHLKTLFMKIFIMQCLKPIVASSLLGPNILISTFSVANFTHDGHPLSEDENILVHDLLCD
jgi:hypothetical protein